MARRKKYQRKKRKNQRGAGSFHHDIGGPLTRYFKRRVAQLGNGRTRKRRAPQRGRGVFWPFLHPDKRGW